MLPQFLADCLLLFRFLGQPAPIGQQRLIGMLHHRLDNVKDTQLVRGFREDIEQRVVIGLPHVGDHYQGVDPHLLQTLQKILDRIPVAAVDQVEQNGPLIDGVDGHHQILLLAILVLQVNFVKANHPTEARCYPLRIFRFSQVGFCFSMNPFIDSRLGYPHMEVAPHPLRYPPQRHAILNHRGNRLLLDPFGETPILLHEIQFRRDARLALLVAAFAYFAINLQHGGLC